MEKILVAGIGNIFLGDDGFGVEVAQRLAAEDLPEDVQVRDFGIRGLHLAYEMLDGGYGMTVLVDASPRGGKPGSLYLIEPELDNLEASQADAHSMNPGAVFATLKALGGVPGRVLMVGCEPQSTDEGIGLSAPVANAVGEAVQFLREIIDRERARRD
jgi:hydrogenase maturation protease